MNPGELVGGALYHAANPDEAGNALLELLLESKEDAARALARGFEPELVRALRRQLPREKEALALACACGVAWTQGRRSAKSDDSWEPVLTLPSGRQYPGEIHRGTAETIVGMVMEARESLHMTAPFVDMAGIGILAASLAASTSRGVSLRLILADWTDWELAALRTLRSEIERTGVWSRVSVLRRRAASPWPHLKVLVADATSAYVGSANVTGAALGGRNLELGVLVRGKGVSAVMAVLDLIDVEPVPGP